MMLHRLFQFYFSIPSFLVQRSFGTSVSISRKKREGCISSSELLANNERFRFRDVYVPNTSTASKSFVVCFAHALNIQGKYERYQFWIIMVVWQWIRLIRCYSYYRCDGGVGKSLSDEFRPKCVSRADNDDLHVEGWCLLETIVENTMF